MPAGVIDVPVNGGMREDVDPHTPSGSIMRLVRNLHMRQPGKLQKFRGTASVPLGWQGEVGTPSASSLVTGTQIAVLRVLGTYSLKPLYSIDGDYLYQNAPGQGNGKRLDQVHEANALRESVLERDATIQGGMDCEQGRAAAQTQVTVYAHCAAQNSNIYVDVIDANNGTRYFSDFRLAVSGSNPRVVITGGGNFAVVFWFNEGTNNIDAAVLDLTNLSGGWTVTTALVAAAAGSRNAWDACTLVGDGSNHVIVLCDNGGASPIDVSVIAIPAMTTTSHLTIAATLAGTRIGMGVCAQTGERVWMAVTYENAGTVTVGVGSFTINPNTFALGASLAMTTTTITFVTGGGLIVPVTISRYSATEAIWAACGTISAGSVRTVKWGRITTAAALTNGWVLKHHQCVSRIITVGGRFFAVMVGTQYFQIPGTSVGYYDGSYVLCDLEDTRTVSTGQFARMVARVGPRIISPPLDAHRRMANLFLTQNSNEYATIGSVRSGAVTQNGRISVSKLTFGFQSALGWPWAATHPATLLVGGGMPSAIDGRRCAEVGFESSPNQKGVAIANGGGAIANGSYRWATIWEWHNDQGMVDRSAPSYSAITQVANGLANANITCQGLPLSLKNDVDGGGNAGIGFAVYRTLELGANPNSLYFRCHGDTFAAGQLADNAGDDVFFVDTNADASIQNNPVLYTSGGLLESQSPSASQHVVIHRGRAWMIGDDSNTLWFSRSLFPGEVASFNDANTYVVPGTRVFGLASMDDKLIVLRQDGLLAVTGEGPNDAGQGGAFSDPILIGGPGCDNWRSVVSTGKGVFYAHRQRGIYLCDKNCQISWIGARVQNIFRLYPEVTSAVSHPREHEVWFTCRNTTRNIGVTLVYDEDHDMWTMRDYTNDNGQTRPIVSATVSNAVYTVAQEGAGTGAAILQETDADFRDTDGSFWQQAQVRLGWLSTGTSGDIIVRRMQIHGEFASNHELQVRFYRDFSNNADSAPVVPEANVSATTMERLRLGPKYTRCQAFSVDWYDAPCDFQVAKYDFSAWGFFNTTIGATGQPDPDGGISATKILDTTANNQHQVFATPSDTSASAFGISVYAKYAGVQFLTISANPSKWVFFDLQAGTVGSTNGGATGSIVNVGGGYFLCRAVLPTRTAPVSIGMANANGVFDYAGTGSNGVLLFRPTVEPSTTALANGTGEGMYLHGFTFVVQPKTGPYPRIPTGQQK